MAPLPVEERVASLEQLLPPLRQRLDHLEGEVDRGFADLHDLTDRILSQVVDLSVRLRLHQSSGAIPVRRRPVAWHKILAALAALGTAIAAVWKAWKSGGGQ